MSANVSLVTVETHFKKVSDKESPLFGKKRPNVQFSFEVAATGDAATSAAVTEILTQYGKALLSENSDNWNYVPSVSALTLANWHVWHTQEVTRGREITKEKLNSFGRLYARLAVDYLGKSSVVASAGATVIEGKLKQIAGNSAAIAAMKSNLETLVLSVADSSESSVLDSHESVINYLLRVCEDSLKVEFTADSL